MRQSARMTESTGTGPIRTGATGTGPEQTVPAETTASGQPSSEPWGADALPTEDGPHERRPEESAEPALAGPATQPAAPAVPSLPSTDLVGDGTAVDEVEDWDEPSEPYTLRRFLRELGVAVAILLLGLPLVLLLGRSGGGGAEGAASAPTGPPAMVLSGSSLPREVSRSALLALGFTPDVEVVDGAGYARAVRPGAAPLAVAARSLRFDGVRLLVLQGGEADNIARPGELEVAVVHLLDGLAAKAPGVPVVLVGPIPAGPSVGASLRRVGATLRQSASARDVPFVDPLSLGWTSKDPDLAAKLEQALRAVVQPATSTPTSVPSSSAAPSS